MQRPSHMVEDRGDRVLVRDVAVFRGFDPRFDAADGPMQKYDRARVDQIVGKTNDYLSIGQSPRLVERHKKDGEAVDPAAYGAFSNVRAVDTDGVPTIFADLEMSKADFAAKIASGRFPRLSAEIWRDGHMSEVAMLGRETPARPLPDLRFSKVGDREIFEMPEGGTFPGGGNTAVPEFDPKKKDNDMADNDDLKVECARLRAENDQLKAAKETFAKQGDDLKAEFTRQITAANERIAAAESEARKEKYARVLDNMQSEGYRVRPVRDELLKEICSAPDADAKVELFKKVLAKDAVGDASRVDQTGASAGSLKFGREEMDLAVKQSAGDPAKYAKILAGEIPLSR